MDNQKPKLETYQNGRHEETLEVTLAKKLVEKTVWTKMDTS